jgi:hypothetical protein
MRISIIQISQLFQNFPLIFCLLSFWLILLVQLKAHYNIYRLFMKGKYIFAVTWYPNYVITSTNVQDFRVIKIWTIKLPIWPIVTRQGHLTKYLGARTESY